MPSIRESRICFQVCRRVLTAAMHEQRLDVPGLQIHSVRSWAMHARVAKQYITREHQRVILVREVVSNKSAG